MHAKPSSEPIHAEALARAARAARVPARPSAPLVALPLPADASTNAVVLAGILAFLAWSLEFLDIDLERLIGRVPAVGHAPRARATTRPTSTTCSASDFLRSVVQTLQMSLLGGLFGVARRGPAGMVRCPQRDAEPAHRLPVRPRLIVGSRAIHEMIWTVLFVMVLGFGMLAGRRWR